MNLDSLSKWLMLAANLGVIAGIIVVVFELRQTQTAMRADSSTIRTQMVIEIENIARNNNVPELRLKIQRGEELTLEERNRIDEWQNSMMRYFENLHYQYELGVVDEEIWNAARRGINIMCSSPTFNHLRPSWYEDGDSKRFRAGFAELYKPPCSE